MMRLTNRTFVFGLIGSCSLVLILLGMNNPAASQAPALRGLAETTHMRIGAAVQYDALRNEPQYAQTLTGEFNMIMPENELKMLATRPDPNTFDFTRGDYMVNFAEANGMKVRGHTLVWYNALPTWVKDHTFTRDELLTIMHDHIKTVVGHYRGRIMAWDVVNEAINSEGTDFRRTIYYDTIGPEYIEMAFRWAHEADPNALLFYADYGGEEMNPKSDLIYNLVKSLVEKGVPIHGVGMQMHVKAQEGLDADQLAANINRIADLGLQVQITEMDVRIREYPGTMDEKLAAQAEIYQNVLRTCMAAPACTSFSTWGFTDKYSWIDSRFGADDPLLWDENYQPKPAYYAVRDVLAANTPVSPPTTQSDGPTIVVEANPQMTNPGDLVDITVRLHDMEQLYGLQTTCDVDPNALTAAGFGTGDAFTEMNSFFAGQTPLDFDSATGQWLVAVSRLQPNPAFSGDGTAFTMRYQASQAGPPQVNCNVLAVNSNGDVLPVTVFQADETTVQVGGVNDQGAPNETPVPDLSDRISGVVQYQSRSDDSGIKVELLDPGQNTLLESITAADGRYALSEVASGAYTLRFSAPQHLVMLQPIQLTQPDEILNLDSNVLVAGDIDGNDAIDIIDAMFVASNLGLEVFPEIAQVDLNADSVVNISDLVLVGGNFGLIGPVVKQG